MGGGKRGERTRYPETEGKGEKGRENQKRKKNKTIHATTHEGQKKEGAEKGATSP